jgi:hypothetical protein
MLEDLSPLRAVSDLGDMTVTRPQDDLSELHELQPLFVPFEGEDLSARPDNGLDGLSNAPGQRK